MFPMQKDGLDRARNVIINDVTHPILAEVGHLRLESKLNTGVNIFTKLMKILAQIVFPIKLNLFK